MRLYLEGGTHLRVHMNRFIRRATGLSRLDLKVIPCGPRSEAIKRCAKDSESLLLIDTEGEASDQQITLIASQIGHANHAFFMVQLMEAWFLADQQALALYYGQGFNDGRLPANLMIEDIPKQDVENGLHDATRGCRKGAYNKKTHAPGLLDKLNPSDVYASCPNFQRLIDFLKQRVSV